MSQTTQGYSGYYQREVPAEDPELTHVGPGTACGEYLRRYWQPVAMSEEVGDLPVAVRILAEDLVVFRDGNGSLGLLHRHCAHRGASLEFGIIMDCGIKCCYHGWHFDIDGRLIDAPSEPAGSPVREKVTQGAYPVHEHGGIIFAYLGPPEHKPPFPIYDTMCLEGTDSKPFSLSMPANWLQVYENTQDPIHVLHLHALSSGIQFGAASGVEQLIDYRDTPLGMINVQTRRVGEHLWTRTTDSILPNCNQTGAIWEEAESSKIFQRVSMLRWMVPIDNTHTMTIGWRYFNAQLDPRGQDDPSIVGKESIDFIGQTGGRSYEEQQRQPGDYEVQVSQRPIAIHALENRVTSDRGVTRLRRLLRERVRAHSENGQAEHPQLSEAGTVSTYCQDTVFPVASAADEDQLMKQFGKRVADVVVESDAQAYSKRIDAISDMCKAEFSG
jgi:phenylpropionate dioxygenase-like ring-hydroxylating dioxygenase large terminal subunit